MTDAETPADVRWNPDPSWPAIVARYETVLKQIAHKYTPDEGLYEDAIQEARIALHTIRPEKIRGYDPAKHGPVTPEHIPDPVDRYLRNVARNSILSCLDSSNRGDWYTGRTVTHKDKATGEKTHIHRQPRYAVLDVLLDAGMQIDTHGRATWLRFSGNVEDGEIETLVEDDDDADI